MLWVVIALAVVRTQDTWAQASIVARADVSATALSVLDVDDVQFGTVTPGLPTVIDPQTSPNAGKFEVRGAQRAEITLDFTLPTSLTVGPNAMPIAFSPTSACHRNRDQQNQCAYFDPTTTVVTRIRNRAFPDNLRIVWVGGTVSPSVVQFPGVYRGSIVLTAAYTGN